MYGYHSLSLVHIKLIINRSELNITIIGTAFYLFICLLVYLLLVWVGDASIPLCMLSQPEDEEK